MALNKKSNPYQETLGPVFAKASKAVIAAVAVSTLTGGGDYLDEAQARFVSEWWILYENKIVTQRPPFPRPVADDGRA